MTPRGNGPSLDPDEAVENTAEQRLRSLLWRVADSPIAGFSETHYAVALTSDLWHEVMDAAGYDEMGAS